MMKRYLFFIMITTVLSFSANRLFAQNSLVLHLPDTVITLNSVDSVYYSHDANGVLMQHVVTMDSLFTFAVDDVDSMFYISSVVTLNGVVRGGIPDSMLVMTLIDVLPVADTNFTVTALRGDYRQLIMVTDLDTLPFMLYRGVLNPDETIVIDTMSTVMALLSWVMPFDSIVDSDYGQFCAIAEQCESFPILYSLVAQSIAANRSLDDTLNNPMYEALGMVFAQIYQQITPPTPMMFSYEQGNNTMLVETSGSMVNMRMRNLNPSYWGQVKNENGITLKSIRVPTRENYGVGNYLRWVLVDFYLTGTSWTDFTSGNYMTFDMFDYSNEPIIFDLTCRNSIAKFDFMMMTFMLPLLSFSGVEMDPQSCVLSTLYSYLYGKEQDFLQGIMTMGSSSLNEDARMDTVHAAINRSGEMIQSGLDFLECFSQKTKVRYNYVKFANLYRKALSAAEGITNMMYRINAFINAPDSISFCMEWFNNTAEDAHYCTTTNLSCFNGNGQVGQADSLLSSPLIFRINALDNKGMRHVRPLSLHLHVLEGGGILDDTIMSVTTNWYYDVEKQTHWRLGHDTNQPQRAVAWLTAPGDSILLGDSVHLVAYFHPQQERIDSFRVKVNTYATFSKGNLQYQPSSGTWRFAEHQYDMIGMDNLNITDGDQFYTGWIDLFSWATRDNPTYVPTNNNSYNEGGGTFFEWGDHPISNGGNIGGMWRTPEFAEWNYLLTSRPNAANLRSFASVVGVNGMIILPDNWIQPDNVSFIPTTDDWTTNTYDSITWSLMENAGAVFLPTAGFRCRTSTALSSFTVTQVGNAGAYWSTWSLPYYAPGSYVEQLYAYRMAFFGNGSTRIRPYQAVECYWGQSVRLIRTL